MIKGSLLDNIELKSNSTILIYDVHASESGALSILNDLYVQICNYQDKSIKWIFAVSIPEYKKTTNIKVLRFPWVKKSWLNRLYFNNVTTRKILSKYKPDKVFSLQNHGISFYKKPQYVYLHLGIILTDHKFNIKSDGKRLWFYQNVLSKIIFSSLRKVDKTIVQTQWMKDSLVKKARVSADKIIIDKPYIPINTVFVFENKAENRRRFFYPATAFTYKNHMTMLKAIKHAVENGLNNYELFLTIKGNENSYASSLVRYVNDHGLNVNFNGPISREEVFKYYASSVLLFPSYVESFGLPLLEAKMTGTPIIAADCPFSREILDKYNNADLFPEMDYTKMGDFIVQIQNR